MTWKNIFMVLNTVEHHGIQYHKNISCKNGLENYVPLSTCNFMPKLSKKFECMCLIGYVFCIKTISLDNVKTEI